MLRTRNSGFTLIELVVVLVILAVLAGLVLPQVDFLRRSADKASGAHGMAGASANLQLYRTVTGAYPDQFDSLLGGTGTTFYANLNDELTTSDQKLAVDTGLSAGELKSLNKVGITTLMDHSGTGFPGDSGNTPRTLATTSKVALINTSSGDGKAIVDSMYPPLGTGLPGSGLPAGVKLLAVGIGPRLTSNGKTQQACPAYSGVDANTTYNRVIAVFAVYDSGKRASLKGTVDSKGDFLAQEVREFYENKPE